MKTYVKMAALVLMLGACTQQRDVVDMQGMLDKMRLMVAQSSLMAAQAACAEDPARAEMITASVVLLRRATAGPEMSQLHVMMGGDMNMDQAGGAEGGGPPPTKQTPEHVAVHAAAGALFDVLEMLSLPTAPRCEQMRPVALAASGALLRQAPERSPDEATRKLDQDMSQTSGRLAGLTRELGGKTAPELRRLIEDLDKI